MKPIPFFDLKEQNQKLRGEYESIFSRFIENPDFVLGADVHRFEKEFARFIGTSFAVGVNSGLDALSLALRALSIGPGDEVIVPANSFIATALAVTSVGAVPVLVDAEPDRLLLDLNAVKKAVTRKTRAVIPVHLYGQPVAMKPLMDLCRKKGIYIVEDACQAHGASIGKTRCGNFGILGCFSFYPGKNLGAFGDGGMITTSDKALYEKLLLLRNYGSVVKYQHTIAGFNTRLDSLQAAILSVKLKHLAAWNRKRKVLARRYDFHLKKIRAVTILKPAAGYRSAHHLYIVRVDRRDELKEFLSQKGVGTGIHYPVPIHLQGAYRDLGKKAGTFPVSEKEAKRVLSLPIFPEMSTNDVDQVCKVINTFFA